MAKRIPKTGMIMNAFIPDPNATNQAINLQQYDDFYKEYDTPEKRTLFNNYLDHQQFEQLGVSSPYKVLDKGIAIFDESATPVSDDEMAKLKPEQQAFATMKNEIIAGYGRVRTPNLAHRTFANSMTGQWVDFLGGDTDLYKGFEVKADGIYFNKNKLSLSPDELGIINDFTRKVSGSDIEKSFLEKAGETTLSLLWDLPLMAAGNYAVQAGMKTTSIGTALLRSTSIIPKAVGMTLEQGVNFNLLGLPGTVKAAQDEGVGGALDAVWHNVKLGAIGAATGTLGYSAGRAGMLSKILPGRPQLQEELASIAGSALFGYTAEKMSGASNSDAFANALSFAAMHFTNPEAFGKVIHEGFLKGRAESNNVFVEAYDKNIHPAGFQPDYFIKEDNKYFKINKGSFKDKGNVEKVEGANPIEATDLNVGQFKEYWKANDHYSETFYNALADERRTRNGEKIYNTWKKELGIEKEDADLHILADQVAYATSIGKVEKLFSRWKFIDSPDLHNQAIRISEEFKAPYSYVKENIVRNVKKYLEDPDQYLYNAKVAGEDNIAPIDEAMFKGRDLFIKELAKNKRTTLESDEAIYVSPDGQTILVRANQDGSVTEVENGFTFNPKEERLVKSISSAQFVMKADKERIKEIKAEEKNKVPEEVIPEETIPEPLVQASDVIDNPSTPGQAMLNRLEKREREYQSEAALLIEGKKPAPENALIDEQGNPLVSPEGKKATEPLRDSEKKAMGIEDKPIIAGKEYDPYSLDTLHDLHKVKEPEQIEIPKEKPRSIEEQALNEAKVKMDTPKLIERGKDISKMNEEELADLRTGLDEAIGKAISDENLRAEVKNSVNRRPELSKEVNDLLELRDKVVTKHHEIILDRRTKEGKEDLDVSNVATPENRRKILTDAKYVEEANSTPDPTFAPKLEKGFVGRTMKDTLKNIGFPKELSFIGSWLDRTKTKVEFVDELPDRSGASYQATNNGGIIQVSRKLLTNEKQFHQDLIHETIHSVLQNPANAKVWEKIQPEFQRVVDIIRAELNNDLRITELEKLNPYVVGQLDYALKQDGEAGFTELVTQALTNPAVARYLSMIKVEREGSSSYTAWDKIKGWIKSIGDKLNGDKPTIGIQNSALDEITNTVGKVNSDLEGTSPTSSDGNEPIIYFSRRLEQKQVQDNRERVSLERKKREDRKYRPEYERASNELYGTDLAKKSREAEGNFEEPNRTGELDEKVNDKKSSYESIPYHEISIDKGIVDLRNAEKSGMLDQDYWKKIGNQIQDKFMKAKVALLKYNDLNIPPIYKAELSPKFRNYAYRHGESMIRELHYHTNRLMSGQDFWNGGAAFHKMAGIAGFENIAKSIKGEIEVSPKAKEFMERIFQYEYGRYTGKIKEDIPFSQFAKWAGFDAEQSGVLNIYRKTMDEAIGLRKEYLKRLLIDFDNDLIKYMDASTIKKIAKLGGYETKEQLVEWRRKVNSDPSIKAMVADYILNEKYGDWGKNFYYNGIRPASPSTHILEAQKLRETVMKLNSETGLEEPHEVYDRISTYFDTAAEKMAYRAKIEADGYRVTEDYQIKELLNPQRDYLTKLNQHQLLELALAGDIPLDNPVIEKLLEATKRGIDLHTNRKEYIPGMKYTPEEFERQLNRFVNESVNGSIKSYYLTAINENLLGWKSRVSDALKSGHMKETMLKEQSDLEYSQRYFNQLRSSDRSFIDALRGYTIAWQVGGIKPSFLFQQASQIFQTTLPQVVQQIKESGGTTGDAINLFTKVSTTAINADLALRAKKLGKDISSFGVDKEVIDILQKLEWMDKISPTGLAELTADANSIDFQYADGMGKGMMVFKKLMTSLGRGVEKWTRTHAALSFYEIGKKRGLAGNDLLNYVADGIDKTMSEWGKGGRAPLFDSKGDSPNTSGISNALKKSFMTYKTFMFNNYGMWNEMIRNRHQAGLATKMMLATGMGGLTRLPLMASLMYVAQMFTDDDLDYEAWKLADKLDETMPHLGSVLHRGIGSFAGVDLRQMWGENTPLVSDLWAESWSKTWEGKLVDISLGAPLGFSKESISALNEFRTDAWNQIFDNSAFMTETERKRADRIKEKIFPVFMRNYLQAARMEKDGIEVQGKKIVMRDDLTAYDIALKVLSFPIEKATRAYTEHSGGVEAQYNAAKEILIRGSQHRRDMIEQGIPQDQIEVEMKRVVKSMNEARQKIVELEPEVRKLKRERKLHK